MNQSKKTEGYTPTPWENMEGVVFVDHREPVCCGNIEPTGDCCGAVNHIGPHHKVADTSSEDAAHIVHCVNMHDELVEALEALVGPSVHMRMIPSDGGGLATRRANLEGVLLNDIHRARSILTKAKGE